MAAKKAAPKKAPAKRTGSNGLIPPPPSKKETAKRNVLNAMKANWVLDEEGRSGSRSPSFSTRQRRNQATTAQAIWNYKQAVGGGPFGPGPKTVRKALENRWLEAEAQAGVRGKNLSRQMPSRRINKKVR